MLLLFIFSQQKMGFTYNLNVENYIAKLKLDNQKCMYDITYNVIKLNKMCFVLLLNVQALS